ncbi:hypothetical protein ACIPW5_29455 [Streptomyces sp. NPDC090077]|uniref:hypothetical protein n=1 Tax=Streptomyces sp. NPDC090077 TaxID=3365938 RepID=UPI0037F8C9D5
MNSANEYPEVLTSLAAIIGSIPYCSASAAIVREAIEARRDMDILQQVIEREPAERQAIIDRLSSLE